MEGLTNINAMQVAGVLRQRELQSDDKDSAMLILKNASLFRFNPVRSKNNLFLRPTSLLRLLVRLVVGFKIADRGAALLFLGDVGAAVAQFV